MELHTYQLIIAVLGAFFAGLVDAIAGGGGLIQLPLLLIAFPTAPFPILSGTNKIASCCGTFFATFAYLKKVKLPKAIFLLALPSAIFGAFLGARTVTLLNPVYVRPVVLIALIIVAMYTFAVKNFGHLHKEKINSPLIFIFIGLLLGFYDGLIGPGTGSFLIFALVTVAGFDLLTASASSKLINLGTNAGALIYFLYTRNFVLPLAILMSLANISGGWIGAHLALSKGNTFVRKILLVAVCAMIVKIGWDLVR